MVYWRADEQLAAIESGQVRRLVQETDSGSNYWRAAENLKRINSSQK
jgi:hypothetical protein